MALFGLFWILIAIATVGCFISRFPGPILAFGAILMAKLFMKAGVAIEWWSIAVIAVLVVASWWVNRMLPKWTSSLGTYGKGAKTGTIIGSLIGLLIGCAMVGSASNEAVGMVLLILSLLVFTYIFAVALEYFSEKNLNIALKNGGIATIVYACSTAIKLLIVLYSVYLMFCH